MSQWFRVDECLFANRKAGMLAAEDLRCLLAVWCLTKRRGMEAGPMSAADVAWEIRRPTLEVEPSMARLRESGLLDEDGYPHDWAAFQYIDDATERVRKHRAKKKAERKAEAAEIPPASVGNDHVTLPLLHGNVTLLQDTAVTTRAEQSQSQSQSQSRAEQSRGAARLPDFEPFGDEPDRDAIARSMAGRLSDTHAVLGVNGNDRGLVLGQCQRIIAAATEPSGQAGSIEARHDEWVKHYVANPGVKRKPLQWWLKDEVYLDAPPKSQAKEAPVRELYRTFTMADVRAEEEREARVKAEWANG